MEAKQIEEIKIYQMHQLRNMVKQGGQEVMNKFEEKYRELWVEPNRKSAVESYYMGNHSVARQILSSKTTVLLCSSVLPFRSSIPPELLHHPGSNYIF